MKRLSPLYKNALYSYLISPLFYITSVLTVLYTAFRFFFTAKFFVAGIGSTDLRPFFNSVPYISILVIPLLVLRLRPLVLDDSIPVLPFKRFFMLNLASFSAFAFPLVLMMLLPFTVSRFGSVDFGQCISGFTGIFFYSFCAVCLTTFLFVFFPSTQTIPLLTSSLLLSCSNFLHLVPLYIKLPHFFSFIFRALSFAWHFDSFGKGILDSRNIFFYLIASFLLMLLSVLSEYRRLGKKTPSLTLFLFSLILVLISLTARNIYFRIDISKNKQFTVSKTSRYVTSELDNELRITYFRSAELKDLYPQTQDVAEFLAAYCDGNKNLTLTLENADGEKLKALGIQGQQLKLENGTKTEFVTVYSAILLQHLDKSTIIPFALSAQTLEYDLTQRIQQLITQNERKVYLLCANGRDIDESYAYVAPWLTTRGFHVEILNETNAHEKLKVLSSQDEIVVLGTKDFSREDSLLLQNAIDRGTKAFIATSPFHTSIEQEWKIEKTRDYMISYLNGKGFAFENSILNDISCYPLTMESGSGSQAEYTTINYPFWISLQSQKEAKQGMTLFWASPISLYDKAEPLLYTSNLAWTTEADGEDPQNLFLTNPFQVPKSAKESNKESSQYIVAAKKENISVISDQFFVSSLMTGFISGDSSGDFRNYDYLTKELLNLRGEKELADLMQKSSSTTSLYKIIDEKEFLAERTRTIALIFIFLPMAITALYVKTQLGRKNISKQNRGI